MTPEPQLATSYGETLKPSEDSPKAMVGWFDFHEGPREGGESKAGSKEEAKRAAIEAARLANSSAQSSTATVYPANTMPPIAPATKRCIRSSAPMRKPAARACSFIGPTQFASKA